MLKGKGFIAAAVLAVILCGLADSVEAGSDYTYVSRDKILGKAIFTYWPHFQLLSDYEE